MKYALTTEENEVVIVPQSIYSVLSMLAEGKSVDEIAVDRGCTPSTVLALQYEGFKRLNLTWRKDNRISALREMLKSMKEIRKEPSLLEPKVDADTFAQEDSLARFVQDLRYAGELPEIQYDVLDSCVLLHIVRRRLPEMSNRRLTDTLRHLGLRYLGQFSICGIYRFLWTSLPPQPKGNIVDMVKERIETRATHLQRELYLDYIAPPAAARSRLLPLEHQLIHHRLDGLPPAKIADRMGMARLTVYHKSQRILKKLGLPSWTDKDAVRVAAQAMGLVSRDPADY